MGTDEAFHEAMIALLERAIRVASVQAKRLLERVRRDRGLKVATEELDFNSDGSLVVFGKIFTGRRKPYFVALDNRKRIDLSIEALAVQHQWRDLFSDAIIERAEERLRWYGYEAPRMPLAIADFKPAKGELFAHPRGFLVVDYFVSPDPDSGEQCRQVQERLRQGMNLPAVQPIENS